MNINSTKFKDLKLLKFKKFSDLRGDVIKILNKKNKSIKFRCHESYISSSKKGTIRGLHGQIGKFSQAKIIYCIKGKALDVAIDLRKNSKTYGKYFSCVLSEKDNKSIFIPPGFAHGFLCLKKENIVVYSCTNYRDKQSEAGIQWNDPSLKIKWPIKKPILSLKDKKNSLFSFYFS